MRYLVRLCGAALVWVVRSLVAFAVAAAAVFAFAFAVAFTFAVLAFTILAFTMIVMLVRRVKLAMLARRLRPVTCGLRLCGLRALGFVGNPLRIPTFSVAICACPNARVRGVLPRGGLIRVYRSIIEGRGARFFTHLSMNVTLRLPGVFAVFPPVLPLVCSGFPPWIGAGASAGARCWAGVRWGAGDETPPVPGLSHCAQ